ncbi:MAG TPA: hypothetical protein VNN73_00860 [Blastocatellia bacterium]|nr:hypothetical protein [Blastocatellia bacterium]
MASLQARSPLRSAHPLSFNKLISFAAFLLLLCVGWVALSYLKIEIIARFSNQADTASPAKAATVHLSEAGALEIKQQPATVRLVYVCAGDNEYYHAATHLPQGCERIALNEEVALRRGLKHCSICLPQ